MKNHHEGFWAVKYMQIFKTPHILIKITPCETFYPIRHKAFAHTGCMLLSTPTLLCVQLILSLKVWIDFSHKWCSSLQYLHMVVSHMLQRWSALEEESQLCYGDMVFVFIDQQHYKNNNQHNQLSKQEFMGLERRGGMPSNTQICVLWLNTWQNFIIFLT